MGIQCGKAKRGEKTKVPRRTACEYARTKRKGLPARAKKR
jgi:hypothetical protein